MNPFEIFLLAIGLGMDCFAVSIASGIIYKKFERKTVLPMAIAFGLFQGIMPLIGWAFALTFNHLIEQIDHWMAFMILTFLGLRMIKESAKSDSCNPSFNPRKKKVIFALAIATSIDALVVGITFSCLGIYHLSSAFIAMCIIGITSFIMSAVGLYLGVKFGCRFAKKLQPELWGGIILIAIGLKILIEHLYFK